jgi:hypothetical protein
MNIQKVCRAGETQVCRKIRMTEAVSFAGSLGLSALVSTGAGLAAVRYARLLRLGLAASAFQCVGFYGSELKGLLAASRGKCLVRR